MSCDLCGSAENIVIWDKAEREKQGKLQSVIIPGHIHSRNVMCKSCGLIYVEPKMSREELARFYAEDYRKIYGGQESLEAEKRHAQTAFKIIENNKLLDEVNRFLDIGCSTGELVKLMDDAVICCGNGIEPNRKHYEIAKSKGLQVENCGIEDYNPGFKFDIITMLNALEHVYSPTEVLTKINSLLDDGGYVLISVPDVYNKTIHLPVDAFLSNAHIYNFSVVTLSALFNKCGFEVIKIYHVVEEIGDKIYLLGQKSDVGFTVPTIKGHEIELTKKHLEMAQKVFDMKMAISETGFR